MQQGGDLGAIYGRLVKAVGEIEKSFAFSHDDRLGFLTFCPTNLGTTIRASVHIKLPKLAAGGHEALQAVADNYQLQVSGSKFFLSIISSEHCISFPCGRQYCFGVVNKLKMS